MVPSSSYPIFLKTKFTDTCYYLIITDLVGVWFRFSDKKSIMEEKQTFNPQFGAPFERILEILEEHLHEQQPAADYTSSVNESDILWLKFKTKIDFYVFQWAFACEVLDGGPIKHAQFLRDHLIMPTFYINKLLSRQIQKSGSDNKKSHRSISESGLRRTKTEGDKLGDDDELVAPEDLVSDPWFNDFSHRSYQKYITSSQAPATLKHNKTSSGYFGTTDTLQLVYTPSVEEEPTVNKSCSSTDENLYKTDTSIEPSQHSNSNLDNSEDAFSSENSQDKKGKDNGKKHDQIVEESAEEIQRRLAIQERIEREKGKKPKPKRKRFV